MVSCKFIGRLGNQMFQKAAAIGLAYKNNDTYTFEENNFPIFTERGFHFQDIKYSGDICLSGYFQSEKYFKHCRQKILDYFNFNAEPLKRVSIHVRRGDYLNVECHPVVTLEYLNKAINHFKNIGYNDKDFLMFTDDKEWCRANFPFEISNGNELEDIELMSRCEHNIISNSSFSFWGSWLNRNPNKIVIAPKIWFAGSKENIDTSDLYCENWIVI